MFYIFLTKCEKLNGVFNIQSQSQSWLATFQVLSSFVHLVTTVLTRQFHTIFKGPLGMAPQLPTEAIFLLIHPI